MSLIWKTNFLVFGIISLIFGTLLSYSGFSFWLGFWSLLNGWFLILIYVKVSQKEEKRNEI